MLPVSRSIASAFLLVLTIISLAVSPAWSEDAPQAGARTSAYVMPSTLPPQLLMPPPEEGSENWQREVDEVLAAQKNISAADLAAMRDEQHLSLGLITKIIGDNFTPQRFPKTFTLLNRVLEDSGDITGADKKFWHTRRPYLTDHRVNLLVDPLDANPSYPSGHTSETRILAEVLGLLYPKRLETLRARASEIAQHRIEAGVHYPVDIQGGENLAMLTMGALMGNKDFLNDLAAARQEITQAKPID